MGCSSASSYYSPPGAITDSPDGNYPSSHLSAAFMIDEIELPDVAYAGLNFQGKWEIEDCYDYARLQISIDGYNCTSLEGNYTDIGTVETGTGRTSL